MFRRRFQSPPRRPFRVTENQAVCRVAVTRTDSYGKWEAYGQNKPANLHFAYEL